MGRFGIPRGNPAWWARAGALELVPLTYQAYYPANAELFALWFVVPFPTDALANASVLVWMALVVLACATIAHEQDLARLPVALALACFVFSPEIGFFAESYCANDLAVAGLGMTMLALAWTGGTPGPRGRSLLSGLAAGLALGTKVSVAPQVLLVAVWFGSTRLGSGAGRKGLAAFLAGVLLAGSSWYARNLLLTGNPVYPAELGPLQGPFSAAAQRKTSLVPAILDGGSQVLFWVEFVGRRFDWPLALGVLSFLGYGVGAAVALRGEPGPRRRYLLLLAGAGLFFLALFPLQPFSGTVNRPTAGLNHLIRYLAWPFLLGLLLFAWMTRAGRVRWTIATTILLALSLVAARPDLGGRGAWLLTGLAAALVFTIVELRAPRSVPVGVPLLVLFLGALSLGAGASERATAARLYGFGDGRPVGQVWRALEELPDGARVAAITNDPASHGLYRPLFGRHLRLQPVVVDHGGRAEPPLHERRATADAWWEGFGPSQPVELAELLRNLRTAQVDFLVVSKWPSLPGGDIKSPWPPAHAALEGLEPGRRKYADGYGEIGRRKYADGYGEIWDLR